VFVALGFQHAMRMHSITLPYVACLAVQYFSYIISQTAQFLGTKKLLNITCVIDFLYNLCLKLLSF